MSLFGMALLSSFLECPKQDQLTSMKWATPYSVSWNCPNKLFLPLLPSEQSDICSPAPVLLPLAKQPAGVCYLGWARALDRE